MTEFAAPPIHDSNMIGREKDIEALEIFLAKDNLRLLTLTGLGGIGKTTLAISLASSLVNRFPGGIFFVALAPITQSDGIFLEIVHTLKVKQNLKKSPLESLKEYLSQKKVLLILDNFEHLMDGAWQINDLLQNLPELKLLITSREPLGLRSEQVYPVAPLSSNDAVTLFMQRALSVNPKFKISKESDNAIEKLCQRLDGLPLAVELAALRTKLFTPQTLLDRLKPDLEPATRMLDLFSSGAKYLPERQQSLRKMIAWSYELLNLNEQRTLRAASVFPATFEIKMLSGLMNIRETQAIDLVSSLVDKNLIKPSFEHSNITRFYMLESIREFAWNEIRVTGELGNLKKSYISQYLDLAKKAEIGLQGKEQVNWLNTLDLEYQNLSLAMEIAIASPSMSELWLSGFLILSSLERYWIIRAYSNEITTLSNRALEHIDEVSSNKKDFLEVKANIFSIVGTCAWLANDFLKADEFHKKSLHLFQHLGIENKIAHTLNNLGVIASYLGDHKNEIKLFEQSLSLYQTLGDNWGQVRLHLNLNNHHLRISANNELGIFHAQKALKFAKMINDPFFIAAASSNFSEALYKNGKVEKALDLNMQALRLAQEFQFSQILAMALTVKAAIEIKQGELIQASESIQEAIPIAIAQVNKLLFVEICELATQLSLSSREYLHVAYLLGVMNRLKEELGTENDIPLWDGYDTAAITARSKLGKAIYDKERNKGNTHSLDEIAAFILQNCLILENKSASNLTLSLLTSRERDVLLLLAHGKSNDEIAAELVVVKKTVEKHVSNVLGKLGVKNRTEAAAWALARGLVEHEKED